MDKATLIFAVVVLVFMVRGYFLGFPRVVVRLLALGAGYEASISFSQSVGAWLSRNTALDGFFPIVAAMMGLFLVAALAVYATGALFVRWLREDEEAEGRRSRVGGVACYGVFGTVVAVPVLWLSAQAHAALYPGEGFSDAPVQRFAEGAISGLVTRVVERAEPDNPAHARMAGEIAARPAATLNDLRAFAESNDLKNSLYDPKLQRALLRNDIDGALRTRAWQRLSENERFRSLMTTTGLAPGDASRTEQDRAMAAQLSDLWRRVRAVRGNPRFQELVNQPEFQRKLNSGNLWAVMADPRSKDLLELVRNAKPANASGASAGTTKVDKNRDTVEKIEPKEPTEVHRWQDEDGDWHFSDRQGQR